MSEREKPLTFPEEGDLEMIAEFKRESLVENFLADLQRKSEEPDFTNDRLECFGRLFRDYEKPEGKTPMELLLRHRQLRKTLEEAFGRDHIEIYNMWIRIFKPENES